ncbi:MAG: hypothetical protein ACP5NL_02430 [Thermoplasmata archaeon]
MQKIWGKRDQFYKWKDQFFEGAKSWLAGKNTHYEFENDKLKQIIGEQTMILEAFKKHYQSGKDYDHLRTER